MASVVQRRSTIADQPSHSVPWHTKINWDQLHLQNQLPYVYIRTTLATVCCCCFYSSSWTYLHSLGIPVEVASESLLSNKMSQVNQESKLNYLMEKCFPIHTYTVKNESLF